MKSNQLATMLLAAATVFIEGSPAFAGITADTATRLPGPGILGLVVVGIAAALGIARSRK